MAQKDQTEAPAAEAAAPLANAASAPSSRNGWRIAAIVGGGVVTAALLFGGGFAVGAAMPDRAPTGFAQQGMPGAPGMQQGDQRGPQAERGDRERPPLRERGGERGSAGSGDAN